MKIIQKTLSGPASFRGVGFLKLNGQHIAICGSRLINCAMGSNVLWCDQQLIMVPPEQEYQSTYQVSLAFSTMDEEIIVSDAITGKALLFCGSKEGLILGANADGQSCIVAPPFKLYFQIGAVQAGHQKSENAPIFTDAIDGENIVAKYLSL